jgi:molybdopterin-guanine dinucleotide biosynthesis protein
MKAFSLVGKCAEKSELVKRLIVELVRRGLTVSTIKRVSDAVNLERQGSGTWKHRVHRAVGRTNEKFRRKEPASDLIRKIAEARELMSRLARA